MDNPTHRVPTQIIAGDSLDFLVCVPTEYQSWTPSARLTGPGQMDASSATVVGADARIKFSGQGTSDSESTYKTAQLSAGQYVCTVWASQDDDRKTIAQFPITILPDLSTGTPDQPHCVRMLATIEAILLARMSGNRTGPTEEYSVDGTTAKKMATKDLEALRNKYAAEVQALQNPNAAFPRIKTVMTNGGYLPDLRKRFG